MYQAFASSPMAITSAPSCLHSIWNDTHLQGELGREPGEHDAVEAALVHVICSLPKAFQRYGLIDSNLNVKNATDLQGGLRRERGELDVVEAAALREGTQSEGGRRIGVGRQVHHVSLRRDRALVLQLRSLYHAPHRHLCKQRTSTYYSS